MEDLKLLSTEMRKNNAALDTFSAFEIASYMNNEDKKVAYAVEGELESISKAIDAIAAKLIDGGKLFYFGAGTSGRLGILDASECPPTFGTDPSLVQGVIAGGTDAIITAIENAEDDMESGKKDVQERKITGRDAVVGLAASGRTPYVIGALQAAKEAGALTISVCCTKENAISNWADIAINVEVGPEVVTGSTRLKSGTAQKMVLNMLSTGAMIRMGKVYGDLMVSVKATNEKLRERVKTIIMESVHVTYEEAQLLAEQSGNNASVAIVMHKKNIGRIEAEKCLEETKGNVRMAILA